jgi:hypothetical protein
MNEIPINEDNKQIVKYQSCYANSFPCWNFIMSGIVTVGSIVFGSVMIGINPLSSLLPFYTSLISGGISFWITPPKTK